MKSVLVCCVALAIVGWGSVGLAGTTDIATLRSKVTSLSGGSPVVSSPTLITVVYVNNGPSAYTGSGAAKAFSVSNALSVTVDIDEPSKPGLPRLETSLQFTRSFAINIPAAHTDSIVADFGYIPGHAGPGHSRVTCTAQGVNVDPVSSNNQEPASRSFFILANVPVAGIAGLVALGAGLAGFAGRGIRRRRARHAA